MNDILPLQIVAVCAMTVAFMTSVRALTRYFELRRQPPPLPLDELRDVQARLSRIEQVVESTALEVERIAEANRFMAKLLADREAPALPRASQPGRVITPH